MITAKLFNEIANEYFLSLGKGWIDGVEHGKGK